MLRGDTPRKGNWTVSRGSIIDGNHAGFMRERQADMAAARNEAGEDANPYGIAIEVMAKHRAKYERLSNLAPLEPLPVLTEGESGSSSLQLRLDGHSVVHLRLE